MPKWKSSETKSTDIRQKDMNKHMLLTAIIGVLLCTSCQNLFKKETQPERTSQLQLPDSLSARRIEFVLDMRQEVARNAWSAFGEKVVEGPFIYFNHNHSEVFFPNAQVHNSLNETKPFSTDYILSARTDSIPYHFELMISFDQADSTKLYFENPVQQFLSVEETGLYIPSVNTTEMWSVMVLHEMFHHFQYNNPQFKEYTKSHIGKLPFDVRHMRSLCNKDSAFLKGVQNENDLLLRALEENNVQSRLKIIEDYLSTRAKRIETYQENYPLLDEVESFYVIQEGSARHAEFKGMQVLHQWATAEDPPKSERDPRFEGLKEFQDFGLDHSDFNYLTYAGADTYHYSIGFNTLRLLEKLGVSFQESLFNSPEKGVHKYLEEYLATANPSS